MRYAICNETFEGWDHARVCEYAAGLGYTGLEIAPFTLAERITDVGPARRKELRAQAERNGLKIIGLHWLLAKTTGLVLTSADESVRAATADYLVELARCCADLGGDILVHGSPAQRRVPAGATPEQATQWAVDTYRRAAPAIEKLGVNLCVEPLSPPDANFMNTAAEAVEVMRRVGSPAFKLHLDVKAMSTESVSAVELIRRHKGQLHHFHANDPNLRGPGFGETDFVPIFAALKEVGYAGWVSVEVFDYTPDPETIASESIEYMRRSPRRRHPPGERAARPLQLRRQRRAHPLHRRRVLRVGRQVRQLVRVGGEVVQLVHLPLDQR
ncbi:MAG: sugar phosphate isomerase/epimerase family protein, partial [Gemmataceae bacterium]